MLKQPGKYGLPKHPVSPKGVLQVFWLVLYISLRLVDPNNYLESYLKYA